MADYRKQASLKIEQGVLLLLGRLAGAIGISRDRSSLRAALARRQKIGLAVRTVIDVGASDGRWSMAANKFFSGAQFLLVEAQNAHRPPLEKLARRHDNIRYTLAAASDKDGEIYFDASDLFGGIASHTPLTKGECVTVQARTIDSMVRDYRLEPPYLLKLDTHGFEVPILEGARKTLEETCLVIIETYNFRITDRSLTFQEMCGHMEQLGFRCIDLCDPMYRPKDGAFWQMDLFFAPKDNKEFFSNIYS